MALAFLSVAAPQTRIAAVLGHIHGAGTPAPNVRRLEAFGVQVECRDGGRITDLDRALSDGHVPIVFPRTGELPYWEHDTAHAVVVVGVESGALYVNDPAFDLAPICVPRGDFELAWDEFGCQWALVRHGSPARPQELRASDQS